MRLTVHFQSVVEKFSHDAIVAFTTAAELSETTLSSIISLRASGSLKSSNSSLRRRRLTEIAEVSSETPSQVIPNDTPVAVEDNTKDPKTVTDQPERLINLPTAQPESRVSSSRPRTTSASSQRNLDKSLPAIPRETLGTGLSNDASDIRFRISEDTGRPSFEQRPSFQSTRPSTRDSEDSYSYRSKVRLGPRPSLDYGSRSPQNTATYPRKTESRPISTLPAGIRMPQRKPVPSWSQSHQVNSRPQTAERQQSSYLPQRTASMQVPSSERPTSKASSVASVATFTYVPESKYSTINTEKQRLMKALQLRQRKLAAKRAMDEALPQEHPHQPMEKEEPVVDMDHEAALKALDDAAYADEDNDIVHVGVRELNLNQENSPVSIPEPSDPPSTQTSSVGDVEEPAVNHHGSAVNGDGDPITASTETQFQIQQTSDTGLPGAPSQTRPDEEPYSSNGTCLSVPNPEATSLAFLPSSSSTHPLSPSETSSYSQPTNSRETSICNEIAVPLKDFSLSKSTLDVTPTPECIPLPLVEDEELKSLEAESSTPAPPPLVVQSFQGEHQSAEKEPNLKVPEEDGEQSKTRPSTGDSNLSGDYTRKTKRRGLVEPIRVISTADNSEEHYLSDDSFMEELQSATVQEAKPISVSRSPITSVFPKSPRSSPMLGSPRGDDGQELNRTDTKTPDQSLDSMTDRMTPEFPSAHRTVSAPMGAGDSPLNKTHLSPKDFSGGSYRSASGSSTPTGQPEVGSVQIAKKVGLSTGISQRIKALEKFTSNPGTQTSSIQPSAVISPAIVSKRKTSIGTPLKVPSPPEVNGWKFPKRNPYPTPSPSPHLNNVRRKPAPAEILSPTPVSKSKPQAITVTARIIRDTTNEVPEIPLDPSEPVAMNLHHSPLKVEHLSSSLQVPTPSPKPSVPSSAASNSSSSPDTKRDTLLAPVKSPRRNSISSRHSLTSRKGSDNDVPKALSETSDIESTTGSTAEKRESKRSRLFKRMSTISSASRRSIVLALSPGLKEETPLKEEESIIERPEPARHITTSMEIGDVNIQFPDTLVRHRVRVLVTCY